MKAVQIALKHLDEVSPRKYTYEEWAWLLKLLGDDEAAGEGYRRVGLPVPEGYEAATPIRLHQHQVWSWMGQESPLMSLENNSEPRWVLKRSLEMLERDRKQRGNRDVSGDAEKPVADPPSPHEERKE